MYKKLTDYPETVIQAALQVDFIADNKVGRHLCLFWGITVFENLLKKNLPELQAMNIVSNPRYEWNMFSNSGEEVPHYYLEFTYAGEEYIGDRTIGQFSFAKDYPQGIFCKKADIPEPLKAYYLDPGRVTYLNADDIAQAFNDLAYAKKSGLLAELIKLDSTIMTLSLQQGDRFPNGV